MSLRLYVIRTRYCALIRRRYIQRFRASATQAIISNLVKALYFRNHVLGVVVVCVQYNN